MWTFLDKEDLILHCDSWSGQIQAEFLQCLYLGLPLKVIQKWQMVQNAVDRKLLDKPWFNHVTPLLQELHYLPSGFLEPIQGASYYL